MFHWSRPIYQATGGHSFCTVKIKEKMLVVSEHNYFFIVKKHMAPKCHACTLHLPTKSI